MLTPLLSMEGHLSERELQLLLRPTTPPQPSHSDAMSAVAQVPAAAISLFDHPQLDLSLSMSIGPAHPHPPLPPPPPPPPPQPSNDHHKKATTVVTKLRRQAAEQVRLATAERAYAERVMELARRELELAEREFARARAVWERARGEVEKVERAKEMAAARRIGSATLEITCHACMQRFHP